jgi:DNA-binding transcriptional LysR family regulator
LPYLGYAPGAYLGGVVDQLIKDSDIPIHLDRVYETDMSEGLKAMALEGHGIAFLPQNAVRKEVRQRTLVSALPPEIGSLEATMEIRAYRARPIVATPKSARAAGRGTDMPMSHEGAGVTPMSHGGRAVDTLWAHLLATQPPASA